jgi:predicted TIM-barrel fold metal-dependent hydrolase
MGGAVAQASDWMSRLIYSEMFDRFPELQVVGAEVGAGWVPSFLEHMDDHWWRNRTWTGSKLTMLPSEYFRRNWKVTFIREPFAMAVRHWIGLNNLMWSNDYPHWNSTWPNSLKVIRRDLGHLSAETQEKVLAGNACRLYGIDPAALPSRIRASEQFSCNT